MLSDITQASLIRLFSPNWAKFQSSITDLKSTQFGSSFGISVVER